MQASPTRCATPQCRQNHSKTFGGEFSFPFTLAPPHLGPPLQFPRQSIRKLLQTDDRASVGADGHTCANAYLISQECSAALMELPIIRRSFVCKPLRQSALLSFCQFGLCFAMLRIHYMQGLLLVEQVRGSDNTFRKCGLL